MDKKQIQALVNKGAITQVGITDDLEKLSNEEICEKIITKHEVAAEVLVTAPKEDKTKPAPNANVETPAPTKTTKKTTKSAKTTNEVKTEEPEAPVVDPVEE